MADDAPPARPAALRRQAAAPPRQRPESPPAPRRQPKSPRRRPPRTAPYAGIPAGAPAAPWIRLAKATPTRRPDWVTASSLDPAAFAQNGVTAAEAPVHVAAAYGELTWLLAAWATWAPSFSPDVYPRMAACVARTAIVNRQPRSLTLALYWFSVCVRDGIESHPLYPCIIADAVHSQDPELLDVVSSYGWVPQPEHGWLSLALPSERIQAACGACPELAHHTEARLAASIHRGETAAAVDLLTKEPGLRDLAARLSRLSQALPHLTPHAMALGAYTQPACPVPAQVPTAPASPATTASSDLFPDSP